MPNRAIQAAKRRQAWGIAAFLLFVTAGVSVAYHLLRADAVAYHRGERAYARGDYAAALPHYAEARAAGMRSTILLWHEATALIETGRPAEALPLLRELLAGDPRDSAALAAAVGVAQASGDPQTGLALYAALGPREKLPAHDLLRLSDLHQQAGQLDDAIACLRLVVDAYPQGADLHTLLGQLLARAGRRAEARAEFEAALRIDPTRRSAQLALSRGKAVSMPPPPPTEPIWEKNNTMTVARFFLLPLLCAAALRANPPPPGPPGPPPVSAAIALATIPDDEARLELARVLVYAKRYDEALVEYRLVLAARPADSALKAEYGQILGWAGRGPEAAATLSALPADSLPAEAAVLLADLLLGEEKFSQAAALYRRALATTPADHATRFKLARALALQKDYVSALAELDHILAAVPDDIQVRRHRAQILGWAGRQAEAAVEWRKTLPAAP